MLRALEHFVDAEFNRPKEDIEGAIFEFGPVTARIVTDYSSVWDGNEVHKDDAPVKLLRALKQHLKRLATEAGRGRALAELIGLLARENRLGAVWRVVLKAAAANPKVLVPLVLPMLTAPAIVFGYDTADAAQDALAVAYPTLSKQERETVETAILGAADPTAGGRAFPRARTRDRLLLRLPHRRLATRAAKEELKAIKKRRAETEERPPTSLLNEDSVHDLIERHRREQRGFDAGAPQNANIERLHKPVDEFLRQHFNSLPTPEGSRAMFPALRELRDALSSAAADDVQAELALEAASDLIKGS
jgi:hypothetical protein